MPRKKTTAREDILAAAVDMIREEGIDRLNARSLAKKLTVSTQPIYSLYKNMEELKADIYGKICRIYDEYAEKTRDISDRLFSDALAYEEFARQEPRLFYAMFLSGLDKRDTVEQVLNSEWNRDTIASISRKYEINLKEAEAIYRDTRFYTHGVAVSLCFGSMKIEKAEAERLIRGAIEAFEEKMKTEKG